MLLGDPQELIVLGQECVLLDDSDKILKTTDENLLVPWCGDVTLLIDRYDCRAHLTDVQEYECNHELECEDFMSEDEVTIEKMCDFERYLDLQVDVDDVMTQEEENKKRDSEKLRNQYGAVDFAYDSQPSNAEPESLKNDDAAEIVVEADPSQEAYVCPVELQCLDNVCLPKTDKQAQIIERTAVFVARQGNQMEIVLKAKQKDNPMFDFLTFDHELNSFYKKMVALIRQGRYVPKIRPAVKLDTNVDTTKMEPNKSINEDVYELKLPKVDISNTAYASLISKFKKVNESAALSLSAAAVHSDNVSTKRENNNTDLSTNQPKIPNDSASSNVSHCTTTAQTENGDKQDVSDINNSAVASGSPKSSSNVSLSSEEYERCYHEYYKHYYNHYYTQLVEQTKSDSQSKYVFTEEQQSVIVQEAAKAAAVAASAALNSVCQTEIKQNPTTFIEPTMTPGERGIIDKMADYVIRNGSEFEELVISQKGKDPRFGFLKLEHPLHGYYVHKRNQMKSEILHEESSKPTRKSKHNHTDSDKLSSQTDSRNTNHRRNSPSDSKRKMHHNEAVIKDRQSGISFKFSRPSSSNKLRSAATLDVVSSSSPPNNLEVPPIDIRSIASCPTLIQASDSPSVVPELHIPDSMKCTSHRESPMRFSIPGIPSASSSGSTSPASSAQSPSHYETITQSPVPTHSVNVHAEYSFENDYTEAASSASSACVVTQPLTVFPQSVEGGVACSPATPDSLQLHSPCSSLAEAKAYIHPKDLETNPIEEMLEFTDDSDLPGSPTGQVQRNHSRKIDERLREDRRRRAAQLVAQIRLTASLFNHSVDQSNAEGRESPASKVPVPSVTPPPAPDSVPAAVAHAVVASLKRRQKASLATFEAEIKARKRMRSPPAAYAIVRERSHSHSHSKHSKHSKHSPPLSIRDEEEAMYDECAREGIRERVHSKHKSRHRSKY